VELSIALVASTTVYRAQEALAYFQLSCLPPYHRPRNNPIIPTALTTLGDTTEFLLAYPSLDPGVPSSHPTHPTHSALGFLLGGLEGRERVDVLLVIGQLTGCTKPQLSPLLHLLSSEHGLRYVGSLGRG
jgi:hypothetical protein